MEEPKTAMELGLEQRMRAMTDATTAAFRAADRAITAGINSMNNFRAAVTIERTREVMDMYEDGLPFQLSGSGSFDDLYSGTTPPATTSSPTQFTVTTTTTPANTTGVVTIGSMTTNIGLPSHNLSPFYCSLCQTWFSTNEALMMHVEHIIAKHVPTKPAFPPVKAKKTGHRQPRPDILADEFIYEDDQD